MIVSHKHKFIFLKTKKTAGTSIELALTKLCGDDDIITPLTAISASPLAIASTVLPGSGDSIVASRPSSAKSPRRRAR